MHHDQTLTNLSRTVANQLRLIDDTNTSKTIDLGARIRGAFWNNGKVHVDFQSDGLSLDQKIRLESHFLAAQTETDYEWSLQFRREQQATSTIAPPIPAPSSKRPFGLTGEPKAIPKIKHVLAVASGKGGVGKSTVSCQLATTLAAQGQRVGLLDADIYGPSASTMLGIHGRHGVSDDRKLVPIERYGVKCVSFGSLTDVGEPVIWRGPLVSKALKQFCFDTDWGDLDVLIVDFPPGTGDVQLTMLESVKFAGAIVVSTPHEVSVIDARKALAMFRSLKVEVFGFVENMATFICKKCGHQDDIFGKDLLNLLPPSEQGEILARIPLSRDLADAGASGRPAVFLEDEKLRSVWLGLCEEVLVRLGLNQNSQNDTVFDEQN